MKAALINQQNIVTNIIVWQEGDVWHGDETPIVLNDDVSVTIGSSYSDGVFTPPPVPAPTPEQLLFWCKQTAVDLLNSTNWTTIPDVANPSDSNPYLINQREFMTWRSEIRQLAVNPVENPVWPTQPTPQWGNKA